MFGLLWTGGLLRVAVWAYAVRIFPRQDPVRLWQLSHPATHRRVVLRGHDPLPLLSWQQRSGAGTSSGSSSRASGGTSPTRVRG